MTNKTRGGGLIIDLISITSPATQQCSLVGMAIFQMSYMQNVLYALGRKAKSIQGGHEDA